MRYRRPEAFRAALEQRLKNEAETGGVALMRLRKRVAFERFLARLAVTEALGWVLKGAFALELRLGLRTRVTKDIDLARVGDEEAATEHLNAAAVVDLGDFFSFEVRRTHALDTAAGFHAVRYTARADLAGRRFEQFPVDVALDEPSPDRVEPYALRTSWHLLRSQRQSCQWSRSSDMSQKSFTPTPAPAAPVGERAPESRTSSTS